MPQGSPRHLDKWFYHLSSPFLSPQIFIFLCIVWPSFCLLVDQSPLTLHRYSFTNIWLSSALSAFSSLWTFWIYCTPWSHHQSHSSSYNAFLVPCKWILQGAECRDPHKSCFCSEGTGDTEVLWRLGTSWILRLDVTKSGSFLVFILLSAGLPSICFTTPLVLQL